MATEKTWEKSGKFLILDDVIKADTQCARGTGTITNPKTGAAQGWYVRLNFRIQL